MRTITRGTFSSTGIIFQTDITEDFGDKLEQAKNLCTNFYNYSQWDMSSFKEIRVESGQLYLIDGNSEAYEAINEAEKSRILKKFNLPEAVDLANQIIKTSKIPKGNQATIYLKEDLRINGYDSALRIEHHLNDSYTLHIHGVTLSTAGFKEGDGIIGFR